MKETKIKLTNSKVLFNKIQIKHKMENSLIIRTLNIIILRISNSSKSRISIKWVMETLYNLKAARFQTVNISTSIPTPAKVSENEHLVEFQKAKPFQTSKLVNVNQVSNTWPLSRSTSRTTTTWESTNNRRNKLKLIYQIQTLYNRTEKDWRMTNSNSMSNLNNLIKVSNNYCKCNRLSKLRYRNKRVFKRLRKAEKELEKMEST